MKLLRTNKLPVIRCDWPRRRSMIHVRSSDSDDEIDYEHLEMNRTQLDNMIRERLAKDNFNSELLQEPLNKKSDVSNMNESYVEKQQCGSSGLVEIK
jgi:hypothetical protein